MAFAKTQQFDQPDIELARLAKAVCHPARIAILRYLVSHKGCICNDIVAELPLSQSTISQHLKALRDGGLIKGSIDGPRICYCLDEKNVSKCLQLLQGLINNLGHL